MAKESIQRFLKTLGPGVLFASTAIGVSHLVQSTRAGADYGFALVGFIIAANVFKYPFFEFGSRYANATGESIIDGYKRVGKWMLWLYFLITLLSMFFVSGAVGAVTSGFLQNLFGLNEYAMSTTIFLFVGCAIILILGKYGILDSLIKVIGAVLLLSTLAAFFMALIDGPVRDIRAVPPPDIWKDSSVLFIIALMGWMPTAVDLSAWNSLWTVERIKQTHYMPSLKETIREFSLGYIISAVLALCFLLLGAYTMFGSGIELPNAPDKFAGEVVTIISRYLGTWSYFIIAASAFSIMFSTCITVFDGYGRSISRTMALMRTDKYGDEVESSNRVYVLGISIVVIGALLLVSFYSQHMKILVDIATTISFLIAPVIAGINYYLVSGKLVPATHHPPTWLKILSLFGFIFLLGFAIYYVILILIQ